MDKAEALAFVSRLFDAADTGAVLWGDELLLKRFLTQCSRTGSQETRDGYRRELMHYLRWRDQHHPHLHLREIAPAMAQDWIDALRQQVDAGLIKPRSFNRRVSAVSSLYRWASELSRSAVTGVPRNPIPPRVQLHAPKLAKPLPEADLSAVLGRISQAKAQGSKTAARDFVLVRGSYLLGCRVTELSRLKWGDIEAVEGGGQVTLLGKGSKQRTVKVSRETLELFESLGRGEPDSWVFPSSRKNGPLSRQAIAERMRRWGKAVDVHLHPHKLRHTHATHAIRRGVDVFTLQSTLGHSSTATTSGYVAANPADSSSLRLG
ncbi:MAG: tyrosine-type recombinase/integrase [Vulcanococcus sp. Clear-D1]|nr:tyrosine-type recombinase/integrase [Vulcanococcus sp. Clear-D1]